MAGRPGGRSRLIVGTVAGVVVLAVALALAGLLIGRGDSGGSGPVAVPASSPAVTAAPPAAPAGRIAKCYLAPGRCGFPDASTTGWRHTGTTLTSYTGPTTISVPGTVIEGKLITRALTVKADGVVIRGSKIQVPIAGPDPVNVDYLGEGGSATLIDTEIVGGQGGALNFNRWTGARLDIHGFGGDGCKLGTSTTLRDSYIHDYRPVRGAHADGCQLQDGARDVVVDHNTIDARGGNSALFISNDTGPDGAGDVRITRNLLIDAGNYTLVVGDGHGEFLVRRVLISGNRLVHLKGSGMLDIADDAAPFVTFTRNLDDVTLRHVGL